MNDDFVDFLAALHRAGARFMVVGAHAMAVHGVPRATGDLDVWIDPVAANGARVWEALADFGAPLESLAIEREDLARPGVVVRLGLPPRRIDILTAITGVAFDEAWPERVLHQVGSHEVPFLGREPLLKNKRATGRPKDLADIDALEPEASP